MNGRYKEDGVVLQMASVSYDMCLSF